jgi:ABC-2 type transport system permease protein
VKAMLEISGKSVEIGWTCGLMNMLKKENGLWLGTGKWIVQSITWSMVITGSTAFVMYLFTTLPAAVKPDIINSYGQGAAALQLFFNIADFTAVIGVIILTHDIIISERESGTAEWVLSKPLSRKAFIISKLISSTIWISAIIVLLQGLLLLIVTHLFGGAVDFIPFAKGLSLLWLLCMFYITMVIFLGTVSTSRGVVLGISFFFFLLGSLVPLLYPESYYFMPWKLSDIAFSLSLSIAWSPKVFIPIVLTAVWSCLFVAGSLWRIERIEI